MGAVLGPCNVTGFDLAGMPGDNIQHLRAFAGTGSVEIWVETNGIEKTELLQYVSPEQARTMARRLFALADEAARPRDPMEGPGGTPLTDPVL